MKKGLFALTMVLFLILCGCSLADAKLEKVDENASVIMTDDATLNGYRIQSPDQDATKNTLYYANKNSKVFHLEKCTHAKRIKNENLYITSNREELISNGYHGCKSCNP